MFLVSAPENWNFVRIFESELKKSHSNYPLIVGLNKSLETDFSMFLRIAFLKSAWITDELHS